MPVVDSDVEPRLHRPVEEVTTGWGGTPPGPPPWREGEAGRSGGDSPPLSNARLGMAMLMGGEAMFFGGLIIAYLQLRLGAAVWPPPGQPRLPLGLTALNTLLLLASSHAVARAVRAARAGSVAGLARWLGLTGGLGALFLAVQGVEWVRLVHFGLTVSSGIYGAAFYTLIGMHAAHVAGALVWLAVVRILATRGRFTRHDHEGLVCCAMYWHFVVALWPILYVLVYLV